MPRLLPLSTLLLFLCCSAHAQIWYKVTNFSGIKTINGVNVKCIPNGNVTPATGIGQGTPENCSTSAYNTYVIGTFPNGGGMSHSFWPRVKDARVNINGINNYEVIKFFMNGSAFNLTTANTTSINYCPGDNPLTLISGEINAQNNESGRITISPSFAFDSIRVQHLNGMNNGAGYELYYANPDTGINIYEPFDDTLYCAGDTMFIGYAGPFRFNLGNIVTIQLSDPYGGFNNPTVLATVPSADSSGTIYWVIPPTITPGNNYRLRALSSNPARMSLPNDKAIKIGVYPPTPIATSNSPVCESHTIQFSMVTPTSPIFHYDWSWANGVWVSGGVTTTRPNATLAMSGNYIVKVSSFGICAKYDTVSVVVNPGPGPINASSNSPICYADTLKLRASINLIPGTTFVWSGPGGLPAYTDTIANFPNAWASGNYVITASVFNCTSTDTVAVVVKDKPTTAAPTNNGPICESDTLKLTGSASNGASVLWSGPAGFASIALTPYRSNTKVIHSGTYIMTATANGCTAKDSTIVTIKPLPDTPNAGVVNDPVCVGNKIFLTVNESMPGLKYDWRGPASYQSTLQNPVINSSKSNSGGFYKITLDLDGCTLTDSVSVVVLPVPQPVAFSNEVICEGDTIELAAGDTLSTATFSWTGPAGFIATSRDTVRLNATADMSGQYVVTSANYHCKNTDTVSMLVKPMPNVPKAGNNSPICAGEELQLTTSNASAGVTFSWAGPLGFSSGQQNPSIPDANTTASGIYRVITDLNGCSTRDSIDVKVKPTPKVAVNVTSPLHIGDELVFTVLNHMPGTLYTWTGPAGFLSRAQSPIITRVKPNNSGVYNVTTVLDGCEATTSITVNVGEVADTGNFVLYPNPNNGNFYISGLLKVDQLVEMEIMNSVGQSMYFTSSQSVDSRLFQNVILPYCANGMYTLRFRADGKIIRIPFIISR